MDVGADSWTPTPGTCWDCWTAATRLAKSSYLKLGDGPKPREFLGELLKPHRFRNGASRTSRKNPKGARNVSGNDVQRIQPRDFWVPYFQTPDKPQWALVQLGGPLFNESMVFEWAGMFTAFLAVLLKNSYPIAKGLQDKGAITPFTGRMRKSTAHVRSHRFQAYSATKRPHSGWWSLQTLSFLIGIPRFPDRVPMIVGRVQLLPAKTISPFHSRNLFEVFYII